MCTFSKPKLPPPIELPPPPEPPPQPQPVPQVQDPSVTSKKQAEQKQKQLAAAGASTLVTGGQGLVSPAPTAGKTLFGQ